MHRLFVDQILDAEVNDFGARPSAINSQSVSAGVYVGFCCSSWS